jgi:hypothetical protein
MDKDELIDSIYRKFQTTMIGSLARFEESFSYLWERDSSNREKFEEIWEDTRNRILNNGNKQAREAAKELNAFFNKGRIKRQYKYNFKFKEPGDSNEN